MVSSSHSGTRVEKGDYLADDEVRVWRIELDLLPAGYFKTLWLILSPDEQDRAERFYFEADRQRSVASRAFLRLLLGNILDLPANRLRFEYSEFGKPKLSSTQEQGVRFNVSHSGDLILIAITRGRQIGVDVERIRVDLDVDEVASHFFSNNESTRLAALVGPSKHAAFFTCWTRKEAYLKAEGGGLSVPLDQFDVTFLPGEDARLIANRYSADGADGWRLSSIEVRPGYVAALAVEGSDWRLNCSDLRENSISL